MKPRTPPPSAEVQRAEQQMASAVRRAIEESGLPVLPAAGSPAVRAVTAKPASRRAARPIWRFALAAAAVLVVGLGLGRALWSGGSHAGGEAPRGYVLRGDAPRDEIAVLPVRDGEARRLRLAWHAFPGADAYRVALHGTDLAELAAVAAGADTSLEIDPAALTGAAAAPLFWRVVALRGGDEIAGSPLHPLPAAN
jgi:hypothetical protein